MPANWLVGLTEFRADELARRGVTDRGYEYFQPKTRVRAVRRGRRVWVESFLMGRYFFVRMVENIAHQFAAIRSSRGVLRLFSTTDGRPMFARDGEIQKLRGSEVRGFIPTRVVNQFKEGDRAFIRSGPFAGMEGHYVQPEEDGELVRIQFMGGEVKVHVPLGAVVPPAYQL